jgi:hypothetical protein
MAQHPKEDAADVARRIVNWLRPAHELRTAAFGDLLEVLIQVSKEAGLSAERVRATDLTHDGVVFGAPGGLRVYAVTPDEGERWSVGVRRQKEPVGVDTDVYLTLNRETGLFEGERGESAGAVLLAEVLRQLKAL